MDIREKTFQELIDNLNKYGKTALVRSTGFGKTFMLTNLIKEYKKVLFLYPTKIIKDTVIKKYCEDKNLTPDYSKSTLQHITFMTYMKLIKLSDDEIKQMDYDLIIFDECHRIGADKTKIAVKKLLNSLPNCHFVGSTATPNRSDAFDIIDTYFDNINVSEYTLHDSFSDGLLQKPYYIYFSYSREEQINNDLRKEIDDRNFKLNSEEKELLRRQIIEIANLYNIETVIEKGIKEAIKDTSYMKFICFFNNEKHVKNKSNEVIKWFQTAFPNHKIETLTITSKTNPENIEKLENLVRQENVIHLIFCIDMLNMGYHVGDITGIIMYRCTQSSIVYIQQLGRALSSGSYNSCIVFDIVDNIRRGSVFETYDKDTIERKVRQFNKIETQQKSDLHYNNETEIENNDYYFDKQTNEYKYKWWRYANDITPQDIYGIGIVSKYKDLIRKTVAETMLQRCKIAFASHFRYWCDEHNIPFPITLKELKEIYGYDKTQFNEYFFNLVKNKKFNYPLGDAELLKQNGMDAIAQIWNLTTEKILYVLGV